MKPPRDFKRKHSDANFANYDVILFILVPSPDKPVKKLMYSISSHIFNLKEPMLLLKKFNGGRPHRVLVRASVAVPIHLTCRPSSSCGYFAKAKDLSRALEGADRNLLLGT